MAATGYTPISLYYSATAAAAPTAGNLVAGELALNTNDGKLYYKDSSNAVQVIGTKGGVGSSTTTQVLYNSSGLVVGSANLTFNGTTLTANTIGAFTLSGTVAGGGNQINNVIIGTTTPLAGFFTTASATTSVTTPSVTNAGTLALSATSTNIITASTNGSERMRIDSSGNVGIGTSSPTTFGGSLVVYAASNPISVIASGSANAYLRLYSTSDNNMYLANIGGSMAMLTANAERMRIDSSGNVGIGTTSPSSPLNVVSASSSLAITINGRSSDNLGAMYFYANNGSTQYSTLTASATEFRLSSVPAAAVQTFYTNGSERMRIDSSGNVGIGTSSPGAKLSVVGTGYSPNITLTDAATIAWDTSTGQVATFTFVSSNRTMGAPTNLVNGGFYALAVIQNAGSNTLTWNSIFKWVSSTAPTLSTAAGAKDYFVFRSDGTNLYQQGISQAVA